MTTKLHTFTALALGVALAGCAPDAAPTAPGTLAPGARVSSVPAEPAALEWQAQARALVGTARMSPLAAGRVYAALSVAQHRAVESVDGEATGTELGEGGGGRRHVEARRGAVAGASARVLGFIFPSASAALEDRVATQADAGAGNVHPHFARGVLAGRAAGDAMVAHLQSDRFTTPWTGSQPPGAGIFTPVALPPAGGTFGGVKPYYMTSGSQFRSPPPPAWSSPDFLAGLNEVHAITLARTPVQLAIALKWDLPAGTPTPIGYWNTVAAGYVADAALDERAATQVLATMHAAVLDALIGCWDAKYFYWTIRPSQANPAIPLALGLPNHPSYPSGHSCASAAAGSVLSHFFPGRAADLGAQVAEAGESRIIAGIHYRFDVVAGQDLGRKVAELAIEAGAP